MIQLDPQHYDRVRSLFSPLFDNLVVDSVLKRHTIGRVYTDHAEQPQTAVLWTQMDTVLLAGNANNASVNRAVRWLLLANLLPDAHSRHIPGFTLYPATPAWETALPEILAGWALRPLPRRAFTFQPQEPISPRPLPPTYELHALSPAFLNQHRPNMDSVLGWIHSFWPSLSDFQRQGLGFAATAGEDVAAWCLSVYAGQDQAGAALELGVETAVSYRGAGLATAVAAACIQQCQQQGITPHWQCNVSNAPSLRLAAKLGFKPVRDYTAYWLPFTNNDERQVES